MNLLFIIRTGTDYYLLRKTKTKTIFIDLLMLFAVIRTLYLVLCNIY